jgi:hypothetical protein
MTPREAARRFCAMTKSHRLDVYGKALDLVGMMKLGKLLARKPEPTAYQRCLAVHIASAAPRSALK